MIDFLPNFDMIYLRQFSTNIVVTIFHLTKVSWRIFAIKGGMSIFHILRVFSMGHDFFSNLDSTFLSFASNIAVFFAWFLLIFEYIVAETIWYLQYLPHYFSIRCQDHAYDHDHHHYHKWDLIIIRFPSTCDLSWDHDLVIINIALDFRPRGPWFKSGRHPPIICHHLSFMMT